MSNEQPQGAPQEQSAQREPRVYLNLPETPYVRRDIMRRDGKTFNEVKCPDNMQIGEKVLGPGWRFNPLYVNDDERNPGMVSIPLLLSREVYLQKDYIMRNEATGKFEPILDTEGKPIKDTLRVDPLVFKGAFDQALVEAPSRNQPQRQSLDAQAAEANVQESSRETVRVAQVPLQQAQARHAAVAI